MSERAIRVLALFNEVILEEAVKHRLPVIDLRVLCTDEENLSEISPIEPSEKGALKSQIKSDMWLIITTMNQVNVLSMHNSLCEHPL